MHKTRFPLAVLAPVLFWVAGAAAQELGAQPPATTVPEVVVIPTIGNDHQFNLDYTVAHLVALIDTISPDALVVSDYTEWLRGSCIWSATRPETHSALAFAEEKSVPIWGTLESPPASAYDEAAKMAKWYQETYSDVESIRDSAQVRLNWNTARIAREYSFNPEPQTLRKLIEVGFQARAGKWPDAKREAFASEAQQIVDSLTLSITSNPQPRRWVVLLRWEHALMIEKLLLESQEVRYRSVQEFLPRMEGALESLTNARYLAWVLSGVLDEWYGMWAPQVFPGGRIAGLLARLEHLATHDPATRFLQARWLMQNRDYEAAELILAKLNEDAGDARFPFPVNGKWIRPPWSSVRDKASDRTNSAPIRITPPM